jgi:WD40 repeat protein
MKIFLITIVSLFLAASDLKGQTETYILKREVYNPGVSCISFSPDGKLLLAGFTDGSFRVLDPVTFQPSLEVSDAHSKAITAIDMPPKMDFILTAGDNTIRLWNREGRHIGNFSGHATTIWNVDISNDGKYAVSSAFNKTFLLWDVYNGVVAEFMRGHEDITLAVCISPDNRLIASGSDDLTVKLWDLNTHQLLGTLHGPTQGVYDVAFSPDSKLLAVASREKTVRIYNVEEEKLVHILNGHRGPVRKVAFSPDGRYLASVSEDKTMILWDICSGEKIHTFPDNEEILLDVEFHPDGGSLYSVSKAGDLTRWEIHPEIFVLRYFSEPYLAELSDSLFLPRQQGESRKDFQVREAEAFEKKAGIIEKYYRQYLQERGK